MSIDDIVKSIFGGINRAFSRGFSATHDGWDIPAPVGTAVRAVRSGTVSYARDARTQADKGASGWAMGGGNVVNINIGNQLHTQYAHLDRFVVKEGQTVKKGDIIGYVGRTGGKTSSGAYGGPGAQFVGAHLHFGVWDKAAGKMIKPEVALNRGNLVNPDAGEQALGAFNDLVKIPENTPLTPEHIEQIVGALYKAGYYEGKDPVSSLIAEHNIREILKRYLGKPWNKATQEALSKDFGLAAENAGTGFGVPGVDILGTALMEGFDVATKLVAYVIAVVLIVAGLFLYARSSGSGPSLPTVTPGFTGTIARGSKT